ncbi:MAG: VOC family protein [Planctomycetes bacterium]|nr:VOC family protein [Planctomycetota bacterium]
MTSTTSKPQTTSALSPSEASAWFEIPVRDFARARRFYEAMLGVTLREERMGPSHMGIFPCQTPVAGGCICAMDGYAPSQTGTVVYLTTLGDLQQQLDRVSGLGGGVLLPKTALPEGMGFYAQIRDSEGNRVGLYSKV